MKIQKSNKLLIFLGIALAIVLSYILLFREMSISKDAVFPSGDTFDIIVCDEKNMTTHIILTDEKTEEMKNILLDIKMRRTIDEKSTIHHTENPIVIHAIINHKPWTFIFGKENCVYGPGFMSNYKILNVDEIIGKIEKMLELKYSFYGNHEDFGIVNGLISLTGTEETFDGGDLEITNLALFEKVTSYTTTFYTFINGEQNIILSNGVVGHTGGSANVNIDLGSISGEDVLGIEMTKSDDLKENLWFELKTKDWNGIETVYQIQLIVIKYI